MRSLNWIFTVVWLVFMVATLTGQENRQAGSPAPASAAQPLASTDDLELRGGALGGISRNGAAVISSHVSIYMDRLGKSGQVIPAQAIALQAAGKAALDAKDYYRAYRLAARAAGWAHGEAAVESYEVAASLTPALNRAIFSDGETITMTLRPLFTLGHPLTSRYTAQAWLESPSGVISGTKHEIVITELREYRFVHPIAPLKDGVTAVCYRLVSPAGDTLAELKHAIVVAKDIRVRLDRMKAGVAAARERHGPNRSPAFVSALDTANYYIRNLEQEREQFADGNWRRAAYPLAMHLIQLNWTAMGRPVDNFPAFNARLRYPLDIDFVESLIATLATDPTALLKRRGEMALACASANDDELLRYRIFVPQEYDGAKDYSLIVALHSGGGDGEFFEFESYFAAPSGEPRENTFERLARQRGYILISPNGGRAGYFGERGEADILNVTERVRATYSIGLTRVFLTGWSGGSEACWRLAMKYPDRMGAAAPVGVALGIARLLTPQNAERARDLPLLYSVPGTESDQGRSIKATAKALLRNFTYTEYPDAEHADVWLKAQQAIFDFFDRCSTAQPDAPGRNQ